ncbi:hypothetical protein [Streptomyces cellulosae]|uniref:hypothetical protein n=1 Tax=Streptomyces cellulosae TaxID=1968 RepID=UPI00099D09FA|nr:hypothetical protein [Streptomyces cellulosae]
MHSEPAIENRAAAAPVRGRRRKRGNGSAEGPVFVDNSGRRSKLLRRIGTLVGVACLGYAVVLGMAFMGIGTSVNPSSLVPFAGGQGGPQRSGSGEAQPQGRTGTPPARPVGPAPTGTATGARPSSAPTASATTVAD